MKKVGGLLLGIGLLVGASLLIRPAVTYAYNGNVVINQLSVDETLSKQNPHGHLDITEKFNVTFADSGHGITRALPKSYHGHPLQLHIFDVASASGASASYTTYSSNGNTVLKIGDANTTVRGEQSYTIHYSYDNVISFYPDHDELYWDVSGTGVTTERVSLQLHVPADSPVQPGARCFAGSYGSNDGSCLTTVTTDGLTVQGEQLSENQVLTFVAGFARGYYTPFNAQDTLKQYAPLVAKILFLPLISLAIAWPLWRKKGRDAAGRGIIIPQYEPYPGLKPIEVGTIMDFKVDNRDMTATIIDLAVHKYLKIIEQRDKNILGMASLNYTLELTNPDTALLSPYESAVLRALFPQLAPGEQTSLATDSRTGGALQALAVNLRTAVSAALTSAGYFAANPARSSLPLIVLIIILMALTVVGFPAFGLGWGLGGVIAFSIASAFAKHMPARTAKGVEAYEHNQGLKLFLDVTEAERFKKTQSPNAAYTQTNEPVKTVELFEKLLPYAVALGVEKGWAAQCDNLYSQAPDWYSGNLNTFSALYLANNLQSNLGNQLNSSFAAPSSSSSSGFSSGGGFSGGGGGGGSVGGW